MFHTGDPFEARARQLRYQEIRKFVRAVFYLLSGKPVNKPEPNRRSFPEQDCANETMANLRDAA